MFGFGKSKAVVGPRHRVERRQGRRAQSRVGKGFKVVAFAIEPIPPDSIVDGAIIDGTAVADSIKRLFENKAFKSKDVAASLSGNSVIVKKINLPVMTEGGARRVDLLGGGAVHPVRHPGRQPRLPDSRRRRRPRLEGHDGRPAGGREEGKDRGLHRRHLRRRAALPVVVDVDAFALQNAFEVELRPRARRRRGAAERRRQRDQHQHHHRRPVGLHARHLDGG